MLHHPGSCWPARMAELPAILTRTTHEPPPDGRYVLRPAFVGTPGPRDAVAARSFQ